MARVNTTFGSIYFKLDAESKIVSRGCCSSHLDDIFDYLITLETLFVYVADCSVSTAFF